MRTRAKSRGKLFRMPSIPWGKAWPWIRERAVSGWTKHKGAAKHVGRHVAILGAFTFVVLLIHHELISVMKSQDRYAIDPGVGPFAVQPDWADDDGVDTNPGSVVGDIDSTLDDALVRKIGEAVQKNPWIKRVISVERVYPDEIQIRYEYREPHLAVLTTQGYVLLDDELIRLPGRYSEVPIELARPEIAGVEGGPPAAGRRWWNESVRSGQELADLCTVNPTLRALGIRTVDVSDPNGRVVLRTKGDCDVHWGRSPWRSDYGELSIDGKLLNLRRALKQHPGLDGLASVKVFVEGKVYVVSRDSNSARGE